MKNNILEAHLYQKVMYMTTAEKKIGFRRCVHEKKKNHAYTPPEKETYSKSPTPPSKVVGDAPLSI